MGTHLAIKSKNLLRENDLTREKHPSFFSKIERLLAGHWNIRFLQLFLDVHASFAGFLLVYLLTFVRTGEAFPRCLQNIFVFIIFLVIYFYSQDGYKPPPDRIPEVELKIIIKAATFSFLFLVFNNFILMKTNTFSRYLLIASYGLATFFILLSRFGLREVYKLMWRKGFLQEKVIIVGSGMSGILWLLDSLSTQRHHRYNILGYVSDKPNGALNNRFDYLGEESELSAFLEVLNVDKVIISKQGYTPQNHKMILEIIEVCSRFNKGMVMVSRIFNNLHFSFIADEFSGLFVIEGKDSELTKKIPLAIKRLVDFVGSLIAVFLLSPVLFFISLLVFFDDGWPVIYRRRAVGKNGIAFDAFKFRTMVKNADRILNNNLAMKEEFEKNYKLKQDPRVTRVGRFLRKLSLDELPQFFNVLRGEMSLVGPRMVTSDELERYGGFKKERGMIRPGMSGFWQVSGRQKVDYEERIKMDMFYIYRWSIWLDIVILLKTILKLLKREGAY